MDVDTLIATLMSLGFDFDSCQLALTQGKSDVESAVEWLLQKNNCSENTSQRQTPVAPSLQMGESSHATSNTPVNHVVSRYAASESQKKAQKDFEGRQRDNIQRQAKKLKLINKEVRKQVLQQFKDDRDLTKTRITGSTPQHEKAEKPRSDAASASCSSRLSTSTNSTDGRCNLKVRLSSGKNVIEVCDRNEILRNIVERIKQSYHETDNVDIIQPFPHKKFSFGDLQKSLAELGLTPGGCLVLKKTIIPDGNVDTQRSYNGQQSANTQENEENVPVHPPEVPDVNVHDNIGQNLEEDLRGDALFEGLNELGVGPVQGHRQHVWGSGVSLGRRDHNPHAIDPVIHAESPAEAALARSRTLARTRKAEHTKSDNVLAPSQDVSSLVDICIKDIARRLPGHHHPVGSLASLSHRMCQKILRHLMGKKTLTPKTLKCFIPCQLQRLVLDHYLYATNDLFHTLMHFRSLTHLSIQSCTVFTDKALEAIAGLKKIIFLDFGNCTQLTDKCLNHLKSLENLETLKLDNTKVTDKGLCDLFAGPTLKRIWNLSLNKTAVSNDSLEALREKGELKELNVEQTNISDLRALTDLKNLACLNVGGTKITDQSLVFLKFHPLLTKLNLHQTQVTDEGLLHLRGLHLEELHLPGRLDITDNGIKCLQDLPLTSLDLTDYVNITDEAVKSIGRMPRLARLSLSKTKISDNGMGHLTGLHDLKELDLERTAVSDVGLEVLSCFGKMEELNLSATNITDNSLISGKLNMVSTLCKLNLSRTNVSDRGIAHLKLPSLTHLNLDWTLSTEKCEELLKGCPQIKALRRRNCRVENRLGEW